VNAPAAPLGTDPLYLDIRLPPHSVIDVPVKTGYHAFIYLYEGRARVGPADTARDLPTRSAGVLSDKGRVRIQAATGEARLLLLAARPINEPVVQYGPFVMNTRQEIEQAVADYRSGVLA